MNPDLLIALPDALPLPQARRVMVLAPHPDDECIGCGGLIAELVARAVPVRVVLVTDGAGAGGLPPGAAVQRQAEFRAALRVLGVDSQAMLGLPDGGLAPDALLFDAVADEVRAFAPNWLLAPMASDVHRDHRCVAQAARAAALAVPSVEQLLEFETWTPLRATHVLDISARHAVKLAALAQHHTALAHVDYLEATRGLARYRALLLGEPRSDAAAEAFRMLGRDVAFGATP